MVYLILPEQAVKNLIALIFTNAPPAVAPYGAKKFIRNKSDMFWGSDRSKIPFILDTSISIINRGKIRVAALNNKKIQQVLH